MKKKLFSLFISVALLATTITGCGGKETADEDKRVESVEQKADDIISAEHADRTNDDTNAATIGQSVTGEGIMVEGPGEDDGIIEVEGDVVEIVEGEVVEIIEGEVTEIIETQDDNVTGSTSDDTTDWSTAYDDYFTRENIMPATPKVTVSTAADGITFDMVVAMVEDMAYMSYDFGTVAMDMYVMEDKVYIRSEMEGQEAWNFALITSEEEAQDMTVGIEDNTTLIDNDSIGAVTYREALEEDGVIYDVLDVTVDENSNMPGTAVYFINRETQMVAKCVMEQQGNTAVCLVEEVDSIELPAEAATATEVPMEDVLGAMLGVLFMGAGANME